MTPRNLSNPTRCNVCGCNQLDVDQVVHGEHWLLAECRRCAHRWTQVLDRAPRPATLRSVRPARTEVAEAA